MVNNALYHENYNVEGKEIINIPDDELEWSTVKLSEVMKSDHRVDASFFDIKGKYAREVLNQSKWELSTICGKKGVATAYRPPICKRIYVGKENGIPMYTPSQIIELDPKARKFLSPKTKTDLSTWYLKEGEIALTCSGTIGNVSIITKTLKNKLFSQNLIRIKPVDKKLIGYIYAFLRTKIGKILVATNNYGAVIKHIDPDHLENIPIPLAPRMFISHINDIVMSSFELRDQSNEMLKEAEKLLREALDIPSVNNLNVKCFDDEVDFGNTNVKLSELDYRLDAGYHTPTVQEIINELDNSDKADLTIIGDNKVAKKIYLPGRFKRIYVKEGQGKPYFTSSSLLHLAPENPKYLSTAKHEKRIKEYLEVKARTILVSCSGTIGRVMLIPKHLDGWVGTHDIIRVIPRENISGYLYTYLNSEYGQRLILRNSYGSTVSHIDDNHLFQTPIPLLKNKDIQKRINDLTINAHDKRYEAYKLEQMAIKIMNEEVIHKK